MNNNGDSSVITEVVQANQIRKGNSMQKIVVKKSESNIKIERYILSIYPNLSYGTLQKAFRKKDIKVNGIRIGREYTVKAGDVLEIYITDELLNGSVNQPSIQGNSVASMGNSHDGSALLYDEPAREKTNPEYYINHPENLTAGFKKAGTTKLRMGFRVVYEDDNVLVVNKAQGIPVHPDKDQSENTLIDQVRIYLSQRKSQTSENCPQTEENCPPKDSFQPSLCHRLDRNTGGLVIIAKNQVSYENLLNKIETREIQKYYKCLVKGRMERSEAQLKAYLWKDARKSMVFVSNQKSKGSLDIVTAYKVLEYDPSTDVSMLEVELITGRTHQIRAHLAFIGHPILGDGKYGTNVVNRMFGLKKQALWAYKLSFSFKGRSPLDYLNGKVLTVEPEFNIKSL